MNEEIEITISVQKLLDKLKVNRERFIKSYDALLQAYEKKVTQYRKEYAAYTKKVITKTLSTDEKNEPNSPQKPENRAKDYDFYINMLENHQGQTITLSESVYRKLWDDFWSWTRQHYYALNASGMEEMASSYSMVVE